MGNFSYSKIFWPSVWVTAAGPLWSCAEARAQSLLWNSYICWVWRQTHAAHANYSYSPEQRAGARARGSGRWMYWTPPWGASSPARGTGAAKRRQARNILKCALPSRGCHVYVLGTKCQWQSRRGNASQRLKLPGREWPLSLSPLPNRGFCFQRPASKDTTPVHYSWPTLFFPPRHIAI